MVPRATARRSYLDEIVAGHRRAAAADERSLGALVERATRAPEPRPFAEALAAPGMAVIAEIKRRSPSRGALAPELDAGALARAYERGGARCLSVLTDGPSFGGSGDDVGLARSATSLPVLRKDFTVDERDVADARLMGADAVLLIVAALSDAELTAFAALAGELCLSTLVEVHDEDELDRALATGANVVGVNARDLTTFELDRELAVRMSARIPEGVVRVAESGVRHRDDVARLAAAGYDAVLVGEHLVTSTDPASATASLLEG
jgi:indole-3-glycerol phosphate synthase